MGASLSAKALESEKAKPLNNKLKTKTNDLSNSISTN